MNEFSVEEIENRLKELKSTSPKDNKLDIVQPSEPFSVANIEKRLSEGKQHSMQVVPGFNIEDYSKYIGDVIDLEQNIDEQRAQSQSAGQLWKGALGQLASETVFGGLEAVGYVFDFEEWANHDKQAEEGFSNWFSDAMRSVKESAQELTPVYRTQQSLEGNIFERMGDGTWWASQGKTVGTTLSLLGPAILAGGAVTALTGGLGAATIAPGLGAVASALFNRKAESAMEAYGTFEQEYNKYLNEINPSTGLAYTDEEAKQLAGQSASKVFKANALMLPMDIAQFALGMKAFSGIKKIIDVAKASKLGKIANYAFQPASEALEEGYQYVAQEEAIRSVREGFDAFGDGLGDRIGEYLKEPDMHESMVLGAAMGGLFDTMMPAARGIRNKYENFAANKLIASNLGDVDSFKKIDNNIERNILRDAAKTGKFDQVAQGISAVMEEFKNNPKYTPEEVKEMTAKGQEMLSNLEYVKEADSKLSELRPEYAANRHAKADYVLTKYSDKKNTEYISNIENNMTQLENNMTDPRDRAVILKTKLNSTRFTINKVKSDNNIKSEDKKKSLDKLNAIEQSLSQQLEESLETLRNTPEYKGFSLDKYTTPDIITYSMENTKKIMAELQKDVFRNKLAQYENMTPEEISEQDAKIKKDIEKKVKNTQKETVKEATITAETPEKAAEVITEAGDLSKEAEKFSKETSETEPKPAYGENVKEEKYELPKYEGSPHTERADIKDIKDTINKAKLPITSDAARRGLQKLNEATNAVEVNIALKMLQGTEVSDLVNGIVKEVLLNKEADIKIDTINEPISADKIPTGDQIQEPSELDGIYVLGNLMEFLITEGRVSDFSKQPWKEEGGNYYLEDKPGGTDYDPNIANDLDFKPGTELEFEVYYSDNNKRLASKDEKEGTFTELQILGVRYVDGKRQVITMLPSKRGKMPEAMFLKLKEIRKQISLGAKEFYSNPENKDKIYKSGIKAKATPVGGRVRQDGERRTLEQIKSDTKSKSIVEALKSILPSFKGNKPRFMLGVVRMRRIEGVSTIYLETPNAPDGMEETPIKSRPGNTMMWITGTGRKPMPVRVYTKNFSKIKQEMPELYEAELAEIRRLLTESNEFDKVSENIKKITNSYFFAPFKIITKYKDSKVTQITITKSAIAERLQAIKEIEDKTARAEAYSNLKKDLNLTQAQLEMLISGKGSVNGKNIYGTQNLAFTINLNAKDATNPNSVFSEEFEKFIQDMQHQVNVNLINKESMDEMEMSYNEQVLKFLETNIPIDRPIHSVQYKLEFVEAKENPIELSEKETKPIDDIEAKKADIERRREEEINSLFSKTQASVDKNLNTPVKKISKEEIAKRIEEAKEKNKDLIAELENPDFLNSKEREEEWDKKADNLSDKLPKGISWRVTNGKIEFFDNQDYREKGFGTRNIVPVNVFTIHNKSEKFEVGDRIQVDDGARALPATVTKVNENGKILEARQDDGRLIILKGNIITTAPIHERLKINAKYEAELAELEKSTELTSDDIVSTSGKLPKDEVFETNPKDVTGEIKNINEEGNNNLDNKIQQKEVLDNLQELKDNEVFKLAEGEVEEIWNQSKELKWLKDNLPFDNKTIELSILPVLINVRGKQAWGSFKRNLIKMYEGAPKGVLYHEAFHAVFGMALNDKQRNDILEEAKKRYGIEDAELLEEALADEFMEYMLSNGYAYKTLPQKIAQFFKNIYTFIKNKLFNSSEIDTLFYNISTGEYKNSEFYSPSNAREKSSLAGSNYVEEYARIQTISSYMSQVVDKLAENEENTGKERVDIIKEAGATYIFREAVNKIFEDLVVRKGNFNSYQKEQARNFVANVGSIEVINGIPRLKEDYMVLYLGRKAFNEFALAEKVKINVQGSVSSGINPSTDPEVLEHNEEVKQIEHWMISIVEQSLRDKTKSEVKSILARIPLRNSKGEIIKDDLGFDKYLEFDTAFATLLNNVSGDVSSKDMLESIGELSMIMPEFKTVYDKLIADSSLVTLFWDALQNTHADFRILIEQKKGKQLIYTWMSANRQQITRMVMDEWLLETISPLSNVLWKKRIEYGENSKEYLNYKQRALNKLTEWYDKRAYEDNLKDFSKFISSLGISVTADELQTLKESTTIQGSSQLVFFANKLKPVLNTIIEGKLSTKGDLLGDLGDNLKQPARIIGRLRKDLMESSFINSENKTIYSHILMGFLPKLVSQLTNKSNFNEDNTIADNSFINEMLGYVGYSKLPWLKSLVNKSTNENFTFTIFDGFKEVTESKGTPYKDLSPKALNKARLNIYYNNGRKDAASYMVPILSDNPVAMFIQHERNDYEQGLDYLFQSVLAEWDIIKNANKFEGIKNFDKQAYKFVMFKDLNTNEVKEKLENIDKATKEEYSKLKQDFKDTILQPYAQKKYDSLIEELKEQKLIKIENGKITSKDIDPRVTTGEKPLYTSLEQYLKEYSINNVVAKANMLMLFTGSPAAYKNTSDVYKRLKQIWSAGKRLDVEATYTLTEEQQKAEGVTDPTITVGENYGVKFVNDIEEYSKAGNDILKLHLAQGKGDEAYAIAASVGYFNKYGVTYKSKDESVTKLFDKEEDAIELAKSKNSKVVKYSVPPGKEFMFPTKTANTTDGQSFVSPRRVRQIMLGRGLWSSTIQDEFIKLIQGKNSEFEVNPFKPFVFGFRVINGVKVPYQIKNSETMLTPQMAFVKMVDGKTTIQLPTKQDRESNYSTYEYPTLAKMLDDMERYSYEDNAYYGTLHFNSTIKVGEYGVGNLDNISNTEVQLLKNEDYMVIQEVSDHFTDDVSNFGVQIRKLIIAGLENTTYNTEYFGDITKEQVIDLWHNLIYNDVKTSFENIDKIFPHKDATVEEYNAKMKELSDRLIKEVNDRNLGTQALEGVSLQKDPGSDGRVRFNIPLFDPLHASRTEALLGSLYRNNVIKQKINGGNLVMVSSVGLSDSLEIKRRDDGSIEYFEADMPYWSKELFADFIDSETGYIDMSKVPDELRKIIGYRIPTEDNYSIVPIKVRRFLPRTSGGIIILPREITTIMGADFDIDKLYMMFPNFMVTRYDILKAKRDFNKANEGIKKLTSNILNLEEDTITDNEVFNSWWEENKESYKLDEPLVKKVKYDTSKSYEENSKEARDNAKMDLIWSVLTNPAMSHKGLNPGNFAYLSDLSKAIKQKRGITDTMDILSHETETKMFEAAVGASALIGVFANQNINHAIFQHGNVTLANPFKFGNNIYSALSGLDEIEQTDVKDTELEGIKTFEPKKISGKLAMMLAAIVDDLKHLNSGPLNINFFTADIISMMMRMGIKMNTSIALINQPVILQLTSLYKEYGSDFNAFNRVYTELYSKFEGSTLGAEALTFKNLWNNIGSDKAFDEKGNPVEGVDMQLQQEALDAFKKLYDIQQSLRKAVRGFRSDDSTRKVTLASNEALERNKDKLMEDKTFKGLKELWDSYGTLKGFYEYGVEKSTTTLNNFFMYNNPAFKYIKTRIAKNLAGTKELSEDNIQHLNFEIMSAALTGYEFFNPKVKITPELTNEQYYIQKFPDRYEKFLKEHPELKSMFRIFNNIEYKPKTESTPISRLVHRNTGTLTEKDKAVFSESWIGVLTYQDSNNPELAKKVRELGSHLIKYTYFAYGFHMDSNSFSQYIPVTWRNGFNADMEMSYNDFLEKLFADSENFSKFAEETGGRIKFRNLYRQIKQNLASNKFFVQRYEPLKRINEFISGSIEAKEYLEANGVTMKGNKPVSFTLTVDNTTMLVEEIKSYGQTKQAIFPDFVSISVDKQVYLFEQVTNNPGEPVERMNYRIVNRLGVPHFHKEYDVNSSSKESIHGFNNMEEVGNIEVNETPTTQQPVQDKVESKETQLPFDSDLQPEFTVSHQKLIDNYSDVKKYLDEMGVSKENIYALTKKEIGIIMQKYC